MPLRPVEAAIDATEDIATKAPEFPRHSQAEHDPKVHTFNDFDKQGEYPSDEEDDEVVDEKKDVRRPLLQELKVTRTSSKKKMKGVVASSSSSKSETMVPVTSTTGANLGLKRLKGLGYILAAAFTFSLMSTCIKYATRLASSHTVSFWRTLIAGVMNYALVRYYKADLPMRPEDRSIIFWRCLLGTVTFAFSFYAISKMALSDATVIIFTSPVMTFVLGAVFLGEPVERIDIIGAVVSYVGVLFVARPAFLFPPEEGEVSKGRDTLALICAMAAAATQAGVFILMRKLQEVHFLAINHFLSVVGVVFSLIVLLVLGEPLALPSHVGTILAVLGSATLSCVGLICLAIGLQLEQAGVASVMRYFDVIFVFIWDVVFLGQVVNGYSVLGAGIIIFCAVVIASFVCILMRKLNEVHYLSQSLYLCLFGIVFSIITLWVIDGPMTIPSGLDVQLALFASAALSCIGVITLTIGFQHEKAEIGSVMRYFDVIFVFVWDSIFLGERVNGYSILGACIIIAGAVFIALRRSQVKK
ncbi:hypothetical protein Poli38472_000763 [Pythium oligandrum]|uniref:EamA domain-containing protein n=1 Tax=Pythium oligandrum TaxID=41045 RepID=A0A8K1FFM9_PYTOL|nr:hypothetical protein Poli38472_000763 [Pythium oligandrum]|eukprot:TMW60721.1 hypothetical protein Poli38472_000763 [Pythium oligandrum]